MLYLKRGKLGNGWIIFWQKENTKEERERGQYSTFKFSLLYVGEPCTIACSGEAVKCAEMRRRRTME